MMADPASIRAQSLDQLNENLQRASSENDRKEIILGLNAQFLRAHKEKSLPFLDTLIKIGFRQNDRLAIATGFVNKGTVLYYLGDLKESSALYYNALEYTDEAPGFYTLKARILNNLGWNYKQIEDNPRALTMFREAIRYGRLADNDTLVGAVLNNLATVQKELDNYRGALQTLEQSIQINRRLQREEQVRFNLNNMGVVLNHLGRQEQAIDTLRKVLAMNYAKADTMEISNNLLNLGIASYNLEEPDTANKYLEQALLIVRDDMLRRKIYFAFDQLMVSKGDYQNALEFSHKFILLTDSINNQNIHQYMLEMDSRYESLAKQRDLEKANLNLANQRTLMYVIIGALLIFIVLAVFLMYLLRIRNRNEKSLREMNEKILKQAEELTASNAQIREINENLEAIVEERTAILQRQNERLLHFSFLNSHRIRGPIASLLGLINILNEENNSKTEERVKEHLHKTALGLDAMVREVSKKLEEEDLVEKAE